MTGTKALDVSCPACGAAAGARCTLRMAIGNGIYAITSFHRDRVKAAAAATRAANVEARRG